MDKVLITAGGIGLIGFIYWFFFGKKEEAVVASNGQKINILVDGGYKPKTIKLERGKPVTLVLMRKDPNSCLEEFILPDFKIKKYLPVGKSVEVSFTPREFGEFGFHCGMNMYHGKIQVI